MYVVIPWPVACVPEVEVDASAIRLDAERRMLHAAERVVLWQTAQAALAAGAPRDAVAAVILGLEVDPERFGPLAETLGESGDPDVLDALCERVDRARFADRAEVLRIARSYAPEHRAATLARLAGVDRARGERVLAGVEGEYVTVPDAERMRAAVERRFARMAASAAVREAFPGWTGAAGGEGTLERIDGAVAAGLPEAVAVGEGVEAALAALDPYTIAVWPSSMVGWEEHHGGAYVGVGVELLDAPDSGVVVSVPAVGGPAWRSGVHAGDRVLAVDGVAPTGSAGATDVSVHLRGAPGSTVVVAVARGEERLSFDLVREEIREDTVRGHVRTADGEWDPWIAPGIAFVRIEAFRPHTDEELDTLVTSAPRAVILDLRGNGGGDVMAAVNVADRFVADGELAWLGGRTIAAPAGGANGELPWNVAIPGHAFEGVPVVVLVDRDTASAAELVAGALRERAGAVLVGERTWGKGLAQALRVDAALGIGWQVTNGAWMLPSRRMLQEPGGKPAGIDPDVAITLSPAERLQVETMRRRRELPKHHPDGTPVPDLGIVSRSELPTLSADPQLVEALRIAQSSGAQPPSRSRSATAR